MISKFQEAIQVDRFQNKKGFDPNPLASPCFCHILTPKVCTVSDHRSDTCPGWLDMI